jgi:hypothetical protein
MLGKRLGQQKIFETTESLCLTEKQRVKLTSLNRSTNVTGQLNSAHDSEVLAASAALFHIVSGHSVLTRQILACLSSEDTKGNCTTQP